MRGGGEFRGHVLFARGNDPMGVLDPEPQRIASQSGCRAAGVQFGELPVDSPRLAGGVAAPALVRPKILGGGPRSFLARGEARSGEDDGTTSSTEADAQGPAREGEFRPRVDRRRQGWLLPGELSALG